MTQYSVYRLQNFGGKFVSQALSLLIIKMYRLFKLNTGRLKKAEEPHRFFFILNLRKTSFPEMTLISPFS
jgi:hypothetical protein